MTRSIAAVLVAVLLSSCAPVSRPGSTPVLEKHVPTAAPSAASLAIDGRAVQGALLFGTVPPGTLRLLLDGREIGFASDGRFLFGIGRDAVGTTVLRAELRDGQSVDRRLEIELRAWALETIASLPRKPMPSAQYEIIRTQEVARINAARALVTDAQGWRQAFVWPVIGRVSGVFGSQRVYKGGEKGEYHSGLDLAATTGTPVVAPADGVVILAADKPYSLEGNLLMIDHGMGLNSAFLHLSQIDVRPGEHVARGQRIGSVGATGRATGPHLHWGMMWRGVRVDPRGLIAGLPPS